MTISSPALLLKKNEPSSVPEKEHSGKGKKSKGGEVRRSKSSVGALLSLSIYIFIQRLRDIKLLSFGAEEGAEEEPVTFKKKPIVRPDRTFTAFLFLSPNINTRRST